MQNSGETGNNKGSGLKKKRHNNMIKGTSLGVERLGKRLGILYFSACEISVGEGGKSERFVTTFVATVNGPQ